MVPQSTVVYVGQVLLGIMKRRKAKVNKHILSLTGLAVNVNA